MEIAFADAFYFIALLNEIDAHHDAAVQISRTLRARLITTKYVLIEVADALAGTQKRRGIESFIKIIRDDPATDIIPGSQKLFDAALSLYASRPDKQWSLTDCASFAVMDARGVHDALTHDHHFEQAGFQILL